MIPPRQAEYTRDPTIQGAFMKDWQKYLAEVFGTFTLVFVGSLGLVGLFQTPNLGTGGQIIVPFAFGLALLAGLYAFGEISGGHFNPAVSLAMFLDRRLAAADLVSYWASQIIGAVLASLVVLFAFTKQDVANTATTPSASLKAALILEIALTAIFVLVILQVTRSDGFGSTALIAIPLTLVAIHFAAVPFSGASVNPARSFGPALVGHVWKDFWIYVVGPAAGAVIGWAIHTVVAKGDMSFGTGAKDVATEAPTES
jgi:aquaporin Z